MRLIGEFLQPSTGAAAPAGKRMASLLKLLVCFLRLQKLVPTGGPAVGWTRLLFFCLKTIRIQSKFRAAGRRNLPVNRRFEYAGLWADLWGSRPAIASEFKNKMGHGGTERERQSG